MTTNNIQKKVRIRKLDILYEQAYSSLLASTILAVSMVYIFRGHISTVSLSSWLVIFLFVTGLRLYSARVFTRSENPSSNLEYWFSWHIFGVIISGIIWGGLILLLVKTTDITYLGLATGCAVGLCAGAAVVYSFSFISFLMFSIPVLGPTGIFLLVADQPTINIFGYFVFLFLITMIVISWRLNKITTHSLSMQIKNEELLELLTALKTEKEQVIDSNNT